MRKILTNGENKLRTNYSGKKITNNYKDAGDKRTAVTNQL